MPVSESAHCSAAITDPGYRRATVSAVTKRLLIRHFFLSPTASSAFARRPKTLLLTKKGRPRLCMRFSFGRDVYATGNSPTARVFDCHDPVRAYGRDFGRGAETCTDAAGRNYDIRADCGEGRVECCNSVYDSNGFARADNLSLWRHTLRQFFGGQSPQRQGKQTLQGLGSGVIVSPDGYILTANHVVSGADEIMVGLGTELRKYKAKKVGTDPGTDVALLKIDEKTLPAITFADSDKARAGDIVLAIGNPFGLRQTVTMGIISAVGRGGMGIVDYENFIQTDAAINMGNSGGALVDTQGRLLGINTAIFSRSGGNQGVGFAIPASLARDVMQSLREKGRVVRGYIGASVQTLTPELAEAMKLKGQPTGALVGEVAPKTPSEKAGMKTGDVITAVKGKKISDARELRLIIGSMAPGSKAQMEVNREGQTKTFDVELAEMPAGTTEEGPETSPEENAQPEKTTVFGGVAVADVTGDVRSALNFPKDIQGAVIAE